MVHKRILAVALTGVILPALALASPLLVHFDGRTVPMREKVQVTHTPAGTVRVRTWSWEGPGGAVTLRVSESPGTTAAMPAWAVAQMRELQQQMRQMQRIEAALQQPLLAPSAPLPVVSTAPLVVTMPRLGLPLETGILQPLIVPQVVLPAPLIAIIPSSPSSATPAPAHHPGLRI